MSNIISNNSDFLFLYEAIQCNPNGDPDQENKPRMDYDTDTNIVTDTRVKRYIRDYLKAEGTEIFVDMEGDSKVSPDSKLEAVLSRLLVNDIEVAIALEGEEELIKTFTEIRKELPKLTGGELFLYLKGPKNKQGKFDKPPHPKMNFALLAYVVKLKFIDVRMFGSAFAIATFNKSYIGPVQMNWGYSLHKVKLMESNSIVTIMNDDNSTFGKDYRVHYSLLAFNGTINRHAAKSTALTDTDVETFRKAIWQAIPSQPTRSKMNQYPKLYVEIIYKDGVSNGQFGDLRQYVNVKVNSDVSDEKNIRSAKDYSLDTTELKKLIEDDKKLGDKSLIEEVKILPNGFTL
jgi:CRISPR-associated protein Csh2